MTAQRNPTTDPQPGDVIKRGKLVRTVTARVGNDVFYRNQHDAEKQCWVTTWQDWAKTASVVVPAMKAGE